jgi:tetratricopeptide (TPR) repeat protein
MLTRRSITFAKAQSRTRFAAALLQAGRGEEAQAVLDALEGLDSAEQEYKRDSLIVLRAVQQNQADTAIAAARKLTEDFADRASAFNLLGILYVALRNIDEAKSAFEQASQIDPGDLISQRYLALIDESTGEFDAAESRYQEIIADHPDAAWAMMGIGRIGFRRENFERAAEYYRRAFETAPENIGYRVALAKVESHLGNHSEAIRLLEEMGDVTEHVSAAVALASIKAKTGDVQEAHEIAETLIDADPDDPVGYALEGEIFLLSRDMTKAEAAYSEAVRLGPRRSHALRLHQLRRELGAADAEDPLVESLAVRPLDTEMRLLLADYYIISQQPDMAITEYERIVGDQPSHAVALNNLAWHYHLAGDSRALEIARRALAIMPDYCTREIRLTPSECFERRRN